MIQIKWLNVLLYFNSIPVTFAKFNKEITLMFLVGEKGIIHTPTWESWRNEYSNINITAFSHCNKVLAVDFKSPSWVTAIKNPSNCKWGQLLSCEGRLLKHAYLNSSPTTKWFVLVSGDTLPVKSLGYIMKRLNQLQKSMMEILINNKELHYIKHSQWMILTREHLEILVNDKKMYKNLKTKKLDLITTIKRVFNIILLRNHLMIPPDEYEPGESLKNAGVDLQKDIINKNVMEVCWSQCEKFTDDKVYGYPAVFTSVNSFYKRYLLESPDIFFFRKVNKDFELKSLYDNKFFPDPYRKRILRK